MACPGAVRFTGAGVSQSGTKAAPGMGAIMFGSGIPIIPGSKGGMGAIMFGS